MWIVSIYINEIVTRPRLELEDVWNRRKWVGKVAQGEGFFYYFFGVTIKNQDNKSGFFHRRVAEITKTSLKLDDGQEIECRWWTRDYSEVDNLFFGTGFNIEDRRKEQLSCGNSKHLVLVSRKQGEKDFSLFDIVSDVNGNFWNKRSIISNFPRYANLRISLTTNIVEIFLKFDLNEKGEFIIEKIEKLPIPISFE